MHDALRELVVERRVTALVHAYCRHFDRNEPDELAALFTSDAVVDYGPDTETLRGREALRASVARGLAETFAATSHHVSNLEVVVASAETVTSRCYVYAWHRYCDGRPDGHLWGRYHHRFVRTTDGWRISRLVLEAAGTQDFHRERMHAIGRG